MKLLIWIVIALVIIGGIAWFMSSNDIDLDGDASDSDVDTLSENGRVIDTDTAVFDEIDDAMGEIE